MDAIDAALIEVRPKISLLNYTEIPYSAPLKARLERLVTDSSSVGALELGALNAQIGYEFAAAANALLATAQIDREEIVAIGSHGQTLVHGADQTPPFSMQLGDPNVIAFRTGITTVADFRNMDIAAGGQGAPLVPRFHAEIFGEPRIPIAVANIGGIANVTLLGGSDWASVIAFDTGPGNTLLDIWTHRHCNQPFDRDGKWASSGTTKSELLNLLLNDEYFSRLPPKSTGREHFNMRWLERILLESDSYAGSAADIQRTLVALTAKSITGQVKTYSPGCRRLILCGGGANNPLLKREIEAIATEQEVITTDSVGVPSCAVEAMAFAWLAYRRMAGLPGNLPAVTGARREVLLGGVYKST